MIKPKTISEKLMFSTVRLAANGMTGTGFFFNFSFKEGDEIKNVPVIVTNKHVINNKLDELVNFSLHVNDGGSPNGTINIKLQAHWIFHPSKDLCFRYTAPLFKQIKDNEKKDVFFTPVTEDLISDNTKLEELSAIEEVVMVGYPNGLWDQANNLPLFRRGITSSHPAVDFNRESIGAVDMACYPGSSGSPIFVLNENGFIDKEGSSHIGAQRLIFIGVLFEGPQLTAKGSLIVEEVPMQTVLSAQTPIMMHLGYYIKAKEILSLKPIVEKAITESK